MFNFMSVSRIVMLCLFCRIEDLWKKEVRNVGAQKASVANVIFQMVKWRLLVVAILCLIFNTLAIFRSVSIDSE